MTIVTEKLSHPDELRKAVLIHVVEMQKRDCSDILSNLGSKNLCVPHRPQVILRMFLYQTFENTVDVLNSIPIGTEDLFWLLDLWAACGLSKIVNWAKVRSSLNFDQQSLLGSPRMSSTVPWVNLHLMLCPDLKPC